MCLTAGCLVIDLPALHSCPLSSEQASHVCWRTMAMDLVCCVIISTMTEETVTRKFKPTDNGLRNSRDRLRAVHIIGRKSPFLHDKQRHSKHVHADTRLLKAKDRAEKSGVEVERRIRKRRQCSL